MEENPQENLFDLQIDPQSSAHLSEAAKWSKFLSIVGFIFCGIILIAGFFGKTFTSRSFGGYTERTETAGGTSRIVAMVIALIMALIYFFPCLFLFNFSNKMQVALRSNDQQQLSESFRNLRSYYKYLGILVIIFFALILLSLVLGSLSLGQ
ncbi:MAG: DUF5362 family protein [Chitinophagales bacterium]